jgi:Straboviridae/Kyanoviridae head completion nuclease
VSKYYQTILDADKDLKFPERYIGKIRDNITIRSSWELIFIQKFLDSPNNQILEWSSEEIIIRYHKIDGRSHRYFIDFFFSALNKYGKKATYLIEIKPYNQTVLDKKSLAKKSRKKQLEILETYDVNQRKWTAAEAYCNQKGWIFKKITEKEFGF